MARRDNQASVVNVDNVHTILGAESTFEGKLSFEGTIRIDGNFKGEIVTNDVLVVGQGAKVEAEVKVGSIIINGYVKGNITATNTVEIHSPGRLFGNMNTPQLTIDKGVVFEGSCTMEKKKSATTATTAAKKEPASAAAPPAN